MVTLQGWLCDAVQYGPLVVTAMKICTLRFGQEHAPDDIGGTYYGPASGSALIEAGRLLASMGQRMADGTDYNSLIKPLKKLKTKFEDEYHNPLKFHLEMGGKRDVLLQWIENEAEPSIRLVDVENKAREILGDEYDILKDNRGRLFWLCSFAIALSKRKIMGDVNNLIECLRDVPLDSFQGIVDIGGRLDYMCLRHVLPKMVLCEDGRVFLPRRKALCSAFKSISASMELALTDNKRAGFRHEHIQNETWVRHTLVNRPCNRQAISVNVMAKLGMWLSGRGAESDASGLALVLAQKPAATVVHKWINEIFVGNVHWRTLVRKFMCMFIVERGQRNGEDSKRILRRLAWHVLYSMSHTEIFLMDDYNRPVLSVVGRRLEACNGSPGFPEMTVVWKGQSPMVGPSRAQDGVAIINAAAIHTKQNDDGGAGLLVAIEAYRKHVFSYMNDGDVQWLSESSVWKSLQLGRAADLDEAEPSKMLML
eukprot:IDg4988t1